MINEQKDNLAKRIGDMLDAAMAIADGGKRISQAELSRVSGVSQPTISRTLKGKSIPEMGTLLPLIPHLGESIQRNKLAQLVAEANILNAPPAPVYNATPIIDEVVAIMRLLDESGQNQILGMAKMIKNEATKTKKAKASGVDALSGMQNKLGSLVANTAKTGTKSR